MSADQQPIDPEAERAAELDIIQAAGRLVDAWDRQGTTPRGPAHALATAVYLLRTHTRRRR